MKQLTVQQATHQLDQLVDAVISGEDVILTRDDLPAVRLVPVPPSQGHPKFGSAKGKVTMSDDFDAPLDDFKEYT